MLLPLAAALLALQAPQPDSVRAESGSRAYLDDAARELVSKARAYRDRVDRSITRYTTRSLERISVGVSALRRDRLLYRREVAARIDWRRDGVPVIEVEGAREAIPIAIPGVRLPEDLRSDVISHAFDPSSDRVVLGSGNDTSSFVLHPLGRNAERHYRYRSGDTTRIQLQDGRTLRLAALEIIPAIKDVHHVAGTIWVDLDSDAMVRGVFTLADEFRLARDADDDEDVPGFLNAIRANVKYLTVEYALWELRWWLPRVLAFEGTASIGSLVHVPMRYELRYDAYTVEGDTTVEPVLRSELPEPNPDSVMKACFARGYCRCEGERCRNFRLIVPEDTAALLTSERLPESIFSHAESVLSDAELRILEEAIRTGLPKRPWQLGVPSVAWGLSGAGLVRYNRIEALSVGAKGDLDLGKLQLSAEARIGVADLEPNAELQFRRDPRGVAWTFGAYRRLSAMDESTRPLGLGNSFNALFFGRDDGEYYRATGAAIELAPSDPADRAWSVRIYAEQQRTAAVETDFSLAHVLNRANVFRPNRAAERADQAGAELALGYARGLNPSAPRWGVELRTQASAGTFDFMKAALTTHVIVPFGGTVAASVEASGGWSGGTVPVQSHWYLGGPGSLRGYAGATAGGEAFWRGRAELGWGIPGARLALFADAGWAGSRDAFTTDPSLVGAGMGGSFLDGLVRLDLARALRSPTGWRLDLYLDGLL